MRFIKLHQVLGFMLCNTFSNCLGFRVYTNTYSPNFQRELVTKVKVEAKITYLTSWYSITELTFHSLLFPIAVHSEKKPQGDISSHSLELPLNT